MTAAENVDRLLSDRTADIVAFARELIAIPTENPPGNAYAECVEYLSGRLGDLGLEVERIDLGDGRTAVLSGTGSGPTLCFHGHFDVVPASTHDQFTPRIDGDRLFGRGSADMKGAIASMAHAVAALSTLRLAGRAALVLVPDEETGGQLGTRRLLERNRLCPDGVGAVLGEPTSGMIWNASRGALTLRVTVVGKPAHVGLHYQGKNAFELAVPIINAITALKRDVERRRTEYHIEPDEARTSILMIGGEVAGGHQFNVVPERFSFTVERRFNPEEDLEEERSRLMQAIRDASPDAARVEVSVIQEGRASSVAEDNQIVRAFQSSVAAVDGAHAPCRLCPGLLESRFYAEAGVPAFAYGPGELDVSHGPHEGVSIERLVACAKIYARFALQMFQRA